MFPKPTILQNIFHKRYTDTSVPYFTTGTGDNKDSMRDVLKEPSPFCIPQETEDIPHKVMLKVWKKRERETEASYDVSTRPNHKSRQTLDLLKRLYVPDEDVQSEAGLLEVDPDYLKIVQGRPIREKLDIRTYVENTREVLKTKIMTGISRDEAMKIDEKYLLEQAQIDALRAKIKLYMDAFDNFLAEDHAKAKKLLHEADLQTSKRKEMDVVVKQLNEDLASLKCAVSVLEEQWRNCKIFQSFLYMISPMYWRKKYDYIHYKKSKGSNTISQMTISSETFDKYRFPSVASTESLDALISKFEEDINIQETPQLYFKSSQELNTVFECLELDSLNSLLHLEEMKDPIINTKNALKNMYLVFESEVSFLKENMKNLEDAIKWQEDKAKVFKDKANNMLNDVFKHIIAAESTLSLHVFVEDLYENCIGPNDSNLGLLDMMQIIELHMESLLLKLDYLPYDIVRTVELQTYKEDTRVMKEAYEAEKKLKLMRKIKTRLKKSLAPPFKPLPGKRLMSRTEPPPPQKKPPKQDPPLTKEERDYLDFFTDFCHHTDNPRSYLAVQFC